MTTPHRRLLVSLSAPPVHSSRLQHTDQLLLRSARGHVDRQAEYISGVPCRDLILDGAPGTAARAPTDLRLRHLTELTRLVLKGHVDHFSHSYDKFYGGGEASRRGVDRHTAPCARVVVTSTVQRRAPGPRRQRLASAVAYTGGASAMWWRRMLSCTNFSCPRQARGSRRSCSLHGSRSSASRQHT